MARPFLPEDREEAERFVASLRHDQILNALENLSGPSAVLEFGPEYLLFVRGLLRRKLESYQKGRRGLVGLPRHTRG